MVEISLSYDGLKNIILYMRFMVIGIHGHNHIICVGYVVG
jgi:hypothetical protein